MSIQYIQIDNFNGEITIVKKDDNSGETLIFNTLEEAQTTLKENCHNGFIVPLGLNIIYIIDELYKAVNKGSITTHIDDIVLEIISMYKY